MVMTMKNAIFWDAMSCGSCKNRHFRGTYSLHHCSVRRLLVTANVVPTPPILVTLMMEALCSSEMFLQEPHGVTSQKMVYFIF
jgi:hypothetical protein